MEPVIRGFWQSRLAAVGVLAASVLLAALIWLRRVNDPVYIPAVASALMLAIGVLLSRLVGNLVANAQNVKALSRLHVDLDPQGFLEAYAPVVARLPKGSTDYVAARSYLADAHAAAGEFDKALSALCPPEEWAHPSAPLRGVYWQKRCSYAVFQGDRKAAREALEQLDELIRAPGEAKPALIQNLKEERRLLQNRLAVQSNRQVEGAWLEEKLQTAPYQLRRLELLQTLAQLALREGDAPRARGWLEQLRQDGGKTFFPAWAAQRLA